MFENLAVFQTAGRMAAHAGRRQAILAQNVANADTPDYKARDLVDFASTVRKTSFSADMVATRGQHLQGRISRSHVVAPVIERKAEADPNGNTVALDQELMFAVEARRMHDRSMAIYRSALNLLRAGIQTR